MQVSLSLTVGIDTEATDLFAEFADLNAVLRTHGFPEHCEPPEAVDGFDCIIGRPATLHFLRRFAAHLALRGRPPTPITQDPTSDPVVRDYYAACREERTPRPWVRQLHALLGTVTEPPPRVIQGPGYEHLLWHSDDRASLSNPLREGDRAPG